MFEEQVKKFIGDFFAEGKRIFIEDVISIIPDFTGYTAIITAVLIVLSPMIGRSILKPLGVFAAVAIFGASILGAF